ncbi:MAG: hypothetical protein KDD73_09210 [Anaerolineales bacterium]|nr:hypothetical protein [Anaerolineales bacterium]
MPRKAIRINAAPPSDEVAAQYLDFWVQGDLYRHPERFPPLTSEQFFGNARPLALEVGPGTAEWLISMAAQQPGWNFLGIDVYPKALYKAVASAHEAALTNIRFIRAPIQFTYPLFQPESLAALYLHYPDPNLRNRDQHKIVNPAFFDVAARALVLGGTLSLITDHETLFFEELLPLVEADPRWARQHEARYLIGFEPEVKSRYQKMWEKHDVPPLRLLLARRRS